MNTMSSALREELHQLLDQLDDEQLPEAEKRLRELGTDDKDPFADMDPEERKKLHAVLEQSRAEHEAGLGIPAEDVLAELQSL
ncbi:MAG: hypothetical protein AAFY60_18235 [Myxococcota bacterium]